MRYLTAQPLCVCPAHETHRAQRGAEMLYFDCCGKINFLTCKIQSGPVPTLRAPVEEAKRTKRVFVQVSRFPSRVCVCVCPYWICLISLFLSCPLPHFPRPQQFFPPLTRVISSLFFKAKPFNSLLPPNLWVLIAVVDVYHLVLLLKVSDSHPLCVSCAFYIQLV